MTITKEQLINQAREEVAFWRERDELIPSQQTAIRLRLAEIAMEALMSPEQEPVADVVAWSSPSEERTCDIRWRRHDVKPGPLYTAPPAPVVPKELFSATEEVLRISDRDHDAWHKAKAGIVSCRAAMLQGAEPVQEWIPCSERMPETDGNYWGWWGESKRQGPVWFIKSDLQAQFQSSEITHWMSLPAAPQQE
ncbi:DUF551 domain-containing protein [Leclercia adecarboxylata]|uniref:DUF551 domain-containing protein n=1 Tax=Leclercia adecarboxylata TaxID=83655 RepID=UPI003019A509